MTGVRAPEGAVATADVAELGASDILRSPERFLNRELSWLEFNWRVLNEALASGKRKIAIFYGGGHMPDLERRLRAELGVEKVGVEWLPAWDVRSAETKAREAEQAKRREL